MNPNDTNGSTIKYRKGRAKTTENQTSKDDKRISTKQRFKSSKELLKTVSSFYLLITVICTVVNLVFNMNIGAGSPEGNRNITGTNLVDHLITSELDKGDELFSLGQMKGSLEKFSEILAAHPQSPRALWGFVRVLVELGNQKDNAHFITDAKVALFDIISIPDVPRDIFIKALTTLTKLYISTEKLSSIDKLWKVLSTRYNYTLEPRRLFLQQLIRHKKYAKRAKDMLNEMAKQYPEDCLSTAMLGEIYTNRNNDFEKGVLLIQKAIDMDCEGIRTRKVYAELYQAYVRLGQKEKAAKITNLGAQRGLFLSPMQRSKNNADTPLTARPWWTYEQSTYKKDLEFLERHWEEIREEGLALFNRVAGPFKNDAENLREEGTWQKMVLFRNGHRYDRNCKLAPITCSLLEKIPDATTLTRGQIKFSVLTPGTHLLAHSSPTNCRIRAHLGLRIPEGPVVRVANQNRTWIEGKFIIFDDSIDHEVWYEGKDGPRLVLIVDFWHPDITLEQRKRIRRFN